MAKVCFYCGNEIQNGERCNCRDSKSSANQGSSNNSNNTKSNNNSGSNSSSNTGSNSSSNSNSRANAKADAAKEKQNRENERKAKERAKEQEKRYRETQRASQKSARPKFNWRNFLIKIMTSQGFSKSDPLPQKLGYSFLQSFLRPVAAIENFLRQNDFIISIFYAIVFSVACGFVAIKFYTFSITMLVQAIFLGLIITVALNGIALLVFRFLAKLKFDIKQILSAFSVPAIFMTIFFMFAASGGAGLVSIVISITLGFVAGALLHLISLKALTRQGTEQIVVQVIFIYVIFSAVLGIIINLITPVAAII